MDNTYVIAVKRKAAGNMPDGWQERLARIEGLQIVGASSLRVVVRATPQAMVEVRALLGLRVLIEKPVFHHTLAALAEKA